MSLAIKIFFSSIEVSAAIVLSLSMFRFQFYYYLHKIYGIALLMSIIGFYFRDISNYKDLSILPSISTEIILIMIVYRIPFFYSLLVCIPGAVAVSIIELLVLLLGDKFQILSKTQVQESALSMGLLQMTCTVIIVILTYLLRRKKIGFLFKTRYLSSKSALKGYNFALSSILVLSIILIQVELIAYNQNATNILILAIMAILFLLGIFIAYIHNKKIIREKYERPVKDELNRAFRNENR